MKEHDAQPERLFFSFCGEKMPGLRKTALIASTVLLIFATILTGVSRSARADVVLCICPIIAHLVTRAAIILSHGEGFYMTDPEGLAYSTADICVTGLGPGIGTRGFIAGEMCRHREQFLVFGYFKNFVGAAMMMMTEQLVSGSMQQMLAIGAFFDAGEQMETQRLFQKLEAQAHKDYQPSMEMCEIGTLSRSLANSQRQGEYNAYFLAREMGARQQRNISMSTSAGQGLDVTHRWEQFVTNFCNPHANDGQLGNPARVGPGSAICRGGGAGLGARDADIDYGRTVDYPNTIPADFTSTTVTLGNRTILALSTNLYGSTVFPFFPEAFFKNPENQDEYMYLRSIIAKRSVARNSFNAIVGMKSQGGPATAQLRPYMGRVLEQLGIPNGVTVANDLLGARPSYYAQMELLTKRLYQRPEFFTGLYDKPANVERIGTALEAIGLMQNMDLFKSKLRTEMALAVLTEEEIFKAQENVQNRIRGIRDTGIKTGAPAGR